MLCYVISEISAPCSDSEESCALHSLQWNHLEWVIHICGIMHETKAQTFLLDETFGPTVFVSWAWSSSLQMFPTVRAAAESTGLHASPSEQLCHAVPDAQYIIQMWLLCKCTARVNIDQWSCRWGSCSVFTTGAFPAPDFSCVCPLNLLSFFNNCVMILNSKTGNETQWNLLILQ